MKIESPVDVVKGNSYHVPCVTNLLTNITVPVLLPHHIDGKEFCLNGEEDHYHVDCRFIQATAAALRFSCCSPVRSELLIAIRNNFDSISFFGESAFFFINRWYRKHGDKKLVNRTCLHQGIKVVNSCGTCPGHGLIWDLNSKNLSNFNLPFYLEMANNEVHLDDNPKGEITHDDKCVILLEKDFNHDGNIIMVDSNGKRYGKMKQKVLPRYYKLKDSITFQTQNLCA
jgi:hypothetical protein